MSEDILSLVPPRCDRRIAYGAAPEQFGHLRLPTGRLQPALVMNIHGGFWRNKYDLNHAGHLCAALTGRGIATFNVEYRRVGDDGGGWPGTFQDIRSAYHFIPQVAKLCNLTFGRVVIVGHSAGAQLALCLAAYENSVAAVVSLAGVVDLRRAWELQLSSNAVANFLGGSPETNPAQYREADPVQLAIPQAAQRLIHGTKDDVVAPEFSRTYFHEKKGRGEDVQLIELENAGHFDLIDPRSSAWPRIEETVCALAAGRD